MRRLTGTGSADALRRVVQSGEFDTLQVPYNLLNPSAGRTMPQDFSDRNYGNVLEDCRKLNLGAFAIRVLAGGAIVGQSPSAHTLRTSYFPLSHYEAELQSVAAARGELDPAEFAKLAIQFALQHSAVHAAIMGFGSVEHVDASVAAAWCEGHRYAARSEPRPPEQPSE